MEISIDKIEENPSLVISEIRSGVDKFLKDRNRNEFDTQQSINGANKSLNNKYLVIDMEYTFPRTKDDHKAGKKLMSMDLIAVEQSSGKIVMIEVKTGLGAVDYKSGIDDHIKDYEYYIHDKNSSIYRDNLRTDVINILEDKIALGIIEDDGLKDRISKEAPELIFVYEPDDNLNKKEQIKKVKDLIKDRYKLIVVSKENYELN